jgi:hypothetical protein
MPSGVHSWPLKRAFSAHGGHLVPLSTHRGLAPATIRWSFCASLGQFSGVCFGMPCTVAVTAANWPPLTRCTSLSLNSNGYLLRRYRIGRLFISTPPSAHGSHRG